MNVREVSRIYLGSEHSGGEIDGGQGGARMSRVNEKALVSPNARSTAQRQQSRQIVVDDGRRVLRGHSSHQSKHTLYHIARMIILPAGPSRRAVRARRRRIIFIKLVMSDGRTDEINASNAARISIYNFARSDRPLPCITAKKLTRLQRRFLADNSSGFLKISSRFHAIIILVIINSHVDILSHRRNQRGIQCA